MNKHGFASDNNSGVHPEIIKAITEANEGHTIAYGNDIYTERAKAKFYECFGNDIDIYFVFIGTAANVLGLNAATRSWNSVICAETAHINEDECGAPERFNGFKLLPVETHDGKLTVDSIQKHMKGFDFEHHSQPRVISITQATELGTVYTIDEIKSLAGFAHSNNMYLHMDGARIANAAVTLNKNFKDFTKDAGVDILSFGGTKNGMMYGEAILFLNKNLGKDFKYIRKQGMQLASKMRFISAQFERYLTDNLWYENAQHSNKMAQLLASKIKEIPQIKITQKVEANGVFAIVPKEIIPELQKEYFFYEWDEVRSEVRWMASFDTTENDILNFVDLIKKLLS
ncbi:MAG: threonine aldolase [Bacteroidetes bacterium GWC2_33_15]|nr:MAG: threonine aldolase [Bacteroidetes bacterium GWA2_33_15]OFX50610.1 MAG: threonine aldolase [Bacteroidetes bacterium GWC2_33_15]OFX64147.1 MAG: threonine aldolase [Bacteroidetes bacterium GWB2_32_14]OFX69759.1 MAG: threonine aldolase [Bacteroidetes bacterium GWD2_33_33]HAN19796.1 threonine aldolase [Bacteroidales bacterium]